MTLAATLRAGTRASRLARWQTDRVADLLRRQTGAEATAVVLSTEGDRVQDRPLPEIGGAGVFTEELEAALRGGDIDFAVHSLKDLPTDSAPDLIVAAVLLRADPRDVLVARRPTSLAALPAGARVGTSSTRRAAQLRLARPDLALLPLRGNVDTRVRHALEGTFDAIVIAAAGVERLGLGDAVVETLDPAVMLPAPGQGALAVQCRADDQAVRRLLASLDDAPVRAATTAERTFLRALGGGCAAPIAALAEAVTVAGEAQLSLRGLVASEDGERVVRVADRAPIAAAEPLGQRLAAQAIAAGARELL